MAKGSAGVAPAGTGSRLLAGAVALSLWPALAAAQGPSCPALLGESRRLVLVTTDGMNARTARLRRFERSSGQESWRALGPAEPAVIGQAGLAWGHPYRALARPGEPAKVEGDKRTPAGFYALGRTFGFAAAPHRDHLVLREGETVCVDDPASPAYNTITSRAAIGPRTSAENMRKVALYRQGLVVDYASDAAARAGSCIFIHVWRSPDQGTAGCIALPEERVTVLQSFRQPGAVIAILPQAAAERLATCLPGTADR